MIHPGCTHEQVYVPQEFFHCVIGPRGSQIKHIRGNYKVDLYIPSADSVMENVIVAGNNAKDAEQREKQVQQRVLLASKYRL